MPEVIGNAGMSEEERVVLALHVSAQADGGTPGQFLEMLAYITQDQTWKKRGQSLREMLEAPPPHGAGVKADDVLRLIEFTHPHETNNRAKHKTLEDMRRVVRSELHEAASAPGRPAKGNNITFSSEQRGTSEDYTLRRLRRDRPDLVERVFEGELSANAAAIEAGFRDKAITIPFNPEGAARALARKFTIDELHRLVELLADRIAIDS
jgi:hypothetical protein